jgi:uncharacterized protein (DUF58 family)
MDLTHLLKEVKELELVAKKNAYSLLSGEYVTSLPGRGLLFNEARKYVTGESIRMIDWNMTARLGEPYVKIFNEEREREVFIALDISPSMYVGWQDKTKIEYATELAATLAVSTISCGDKLGFILFNDKAVKVVKPKTGKIQLFRALKTFLDYSNAEPLPCEVSDIRAAIHAVQQFRGKRFIIFIISDYIDRDVPEDLKYIRGVHDLSLVHVFDPFEYTKNNDILFDAISPEGKQAGKIISPGTTATLGSIQTYLKEESYKYRITYQSISTKTPVDMALRNLFHNKKKGIFR